MSIAKGASSLLANLISWMNFSSIPPLKNPTNDILYVFIHGI